MTTPSAIHPIYRFGSFEIDPDSAELRKNGARVKIQDQPFQILLRLLESPDKIVSREELRATLWPADTFVDFDNGLNMAMKRLREVLSDVADRPTFIETVPRRGYRFIAPLQKHTAIKETAGGCDLGRVAEASKASRKWVALSFAVLIPAIGFAGWRLLGPKSEADPLSSIEVVPLVGNGREHSPHFSPDGSRVSFVARGENPGIYTAVVGSDKSLRLTTDSSDRCPSWSPDGRQIAFIRDAEEGIAIYSISALGGSERHLYSGPANNFRRTLDWSPDGRFLVFSQTGKDKTHSWIALLSLADYTTRQLTSPPNDELDYAAAFSPRASEIAFVRNSVGGIISDLYVVPVSGGVPKRITFDSRTIYGQPRWTPDASELIFSSTRGGVPTLWRVSSAGGTPKAIPGVGPAIFPAISAKGDQLAYDRSSGSSSFWELDLKDEKHARNHPRDLITQNGIRPQFSPDGKKIAFQSDRLGYMEIWTCDRDGSNCGQLTFLRGHAGAPRWSPDGRYIAFENHLKDHSEVFVVEVPSGVPMQITTLPGSDDGGPNWSRDGKSIYFYSDRGGGPFQVWRVPLTGGPPVQVTKNGGIFATESADGRFIYYSKFETHGIWRLPMNGGEEVRVLDQIGGLAWSNWALGQNGIYFIGKLPERRNSSVQFFDFSTHKTIPIWTLERPASLGLALSDDGASILYTQTDFAQSDIMLVKNFH